MSIRPLLLALPLALAACQTEPAEAPAADAAVAPAASGPVVSDAYVPAAPEDGIGGVFMTIAGGAEADTLVGARSADAERVELHETFDRGDGLRGMREVEGGVPVPAGGTAELRPGGYHVMLIGLRRGLAPGDTVALDVEFAQAGTVAVRAVVRSLDAVGAPSE